MMHSPYKWLYIYYLNGCLKENRILSGDEFIGNWEEDGDSFLFFSQPSRRKVENLLKDQPHLKLRDEYRMSYEEWQGGPVVPFIIGHIRIAPPWMRHPLPSIDLSVSRKRGAEDMIEILLDPGVVFGNGAHPTTHHCIEALEMLYASDRPERVLDLGTGTGLLAVVAARLGCCRALAVDLNLLAVQTAKKNIALNRLNDRVLAVQGNAENFVDLSSDLVISNIHYDVMKRLIGSEGFLSKKYFILSGLLRNQATQIERALNQYPVAMTKKWEHEGVWHTYLGRTV